MQWRMHSRRTTPAALGIAALLALACSDTVVAPPAGPSLAGEVPPPGVPHVEVCKVGREGETVVFGIFSAGGNGGQLLQGGSFPLTAGECKTVWQAIGVQPSQVLVSVTETSTEADLERIEVFDATGFRTITDSRTVEVLVGIGTGGAEMTFFNRIPEPPPVGGEGCTPGYWKQSHHFDSWPASLTPGSDFDAVFGVNLFATNRTLLRALSTGGGKANRLGRHATAALLNATTGSGVSYGMTRSEVIALVQSAVASGKLDAASDVFEKLNEEGCPLN